MEPSKRSEGKKKKTLRVLARLLELQGKFSFVASEQKSKSLVADYAKVETQDESEAAAWLTAAWPAGLSWPAEGGKKERGKGKDKGGGWDFCPAVPASGSMLCTEDDGQRLCNNLTSVYSISKVNKANSTACTCL